MKSICRLSNGIRLGWRSGFDSGVTQHSQGCLNVCQPPLSARAGERSFSSRHLFQGAGGTRPIRVLWGLNSTNPYHIAPSI
jgi:hypothetical protein